MVYVRQKRNPTWHVLKHASWGGLVAHCGDRWMPSDAETREAKAFAFPPSELESCPTCAKFVIPPDPKEAA